MRCDICGGKPSNCDCTSIEVEMFEKMRELEQELADANARIVQLDEENAQLLKKLTETTSELIMIKHKGLLKKLAESGD